MANQIFRILLLGCGNMTRSLALGMAQTQKSLHFYCYTPSQVRAQALVEQIHQKNGEATFIPTLFDLHPHIKKTAFDLVIIGCKPQQFCDLLSSLKKEKLFTEATFLKSHVISLMAGVSLLEIEKRWKSEIIRLMPNTPSAHGQGVLLFASREKRNQGHYQKILDLFSVCGLTHWCQNEDELTLLTPFCASGPGLFFEIIHLWQEQLVLKGIPSSLSGKLLGQTLLGTGAMIMQSEKEARELRDQVTSKAGVTFAALQVYQEKKIGEIFAQSFNAAFKRNNEIELQIKEELQKDLLL